MIKEFTASIKDKNYKITLNDHSTSGTINQNSFTLDISKLNPTRIHALINHQSYNIELLSINKEEKKVTLTVNGHKYEVKLEDQYDHLLKNLGLDILTKNKINEIKAPMPGLVVNVLVNQGDVVEKDHPLLVLEAMKMENILKSPGRGMVKKINVSKGQAVEKNNVLIQFE
jgi:biotin carboxyl carrier protein